MTAREYCALHPAIAYYSGFSGFEIHGIEELNGNTVIYGCTGTWTSPRYYSYHRLRVYYPDKPSASPYVKLHGYRIRLDECIRMGLQ